MIAWNGSSRARRLGIAGAILCLASACETQSAACGGEGDEAGGCLESVRLTYLNVRYDLDRPVFVNNRVPVEYGLTATSPDPAAPQTRVVAVGFSFVEAEPADPANPIECGSNAFDVELLGDGEEHTFSGFIWPTTLCEALVGRAVNVRVDFDGGAELSESGIDYPSVTFTEAAREAELNQACRSVADPNATDAGRGCVYTVDLALTPSDESGSLIDVRYAGMAPASSVAILPYVEPGAPEVELLPSIVVQSTLVVNGRDPYVTGVAPEDVPPGLEELEPGITEDLRFGLDPSELDRLTAMPGRATLRYELAPAGAETGFRALTIGDPGSEAGGDHVDAVVIESLLPGTANTFAHELFAEGATRAALDEGGEWADVSDFSLRGCFEAEFAQAGNEGDGDASDCRTLPIVLVRETPNATSATSIGFDQELRRQLGNPSRLAMSAELVTQNRLDRDGAFSRVEGGVEIEGRLGRSFSVTVARAVGQASLDVESGEAAYEVSVDAFNQRIYSVSESDPNLEHEEEFSAARSFSFPGLGFGFGPVHVGFSFSVGGEVGLDTADRLTVTTNADECATLLGTSTHPLTACGSIGRTVTPRFAFTASIEGGIDLRIVRAGIRADLRLVETDFPLDASLAWGLGEDGRPLVLGNVRWELGMQLISGDVAIVGRVGIRRFSRSLRVNLFSFSSRRFTQTLLDRSMGSFEVLE